MPALCCVSLCPHAVARSDALNVSQSDCLLYHRTNNHIYAQVVDDAKGHVLVSASTVEKGGRKEYGGNCDSAIEVGKRIASRAIEKGVEQVYFDRNGFKYHGRVAALADAAREAGLSF